MNTEKLVKLSESPTYVIGVFLIKFSRELQRKCSHQEKSLTYPGNPLKGRGLTYPRTLRKNPHINENVQKKNECNTHLQ